MTIEPRSARTLHPALRALHERARNTAALHRLALVSRILLALAFVPTALVKLQGLRFTTVSISTPIGYFFEALYQSGMYWRFIGASQLIAGALLLLPATSTLGALLFFPIVLNIFVITVSLHFTGTPVITGLMLLACSFLLCWDYHRFAAVLWGPQASYEVPQAPVFLPVERLGYLVGTAGALGMLFWSRGLAGAGSARTLLLACAVLAATGAGLVITGWVRVSSPSR